MLVAIWFSFKQVKLMARRRYTLFLYQCSSSIRVINLSEPCQASISHLLLKLHGRCHPHVPNTFHVSVVVRGYIGLFWLIYEVNLTWLNSLKGIPHSICFDSICTYCNLLYARYWIQCQDITVDKITLKTNNNKNRQNTSCLRGAYILEGELMVRAMVRSIRKICSVLMVIDNKEKRSKIKWEERIGAGLQL